LPDNLKIKFHMFDSSNLDNDDKGITLYLLLILLLQKKKKKKKKKKKI